MENHTLIEENILKEDLELKRLEIENRKLEIELEKLGIEKSKQFWTILIGTLPLLGVVMTIFYSIYSQQKNEENIFKMKAVEIMFQTSDVYEAKTKAEILKTIFPDKLPNDFSNNFNPDSLGGFNTYEVASQKELLRQISSNPDKKNEIIKCWKEMFPYDKWIEDFGNK